MTSSPDLIPKYQEILNRKDCYKGKSISNVLVSIPNLQGEQMASICKYVTLELAGQGQSGGEDTERIELFVKEMPKNTPHARMLGELHVFAREAQFFNELLPDLQKYYMEKSGLPDHVTFLSRPGEKGTLPIYGKNNETYYAMPTNMRGWNPWTIYSCSFSSLKKPLDFFPNCFHADDNEVILENLVKTYGYYLNPKEGRQDLEHARMTLENYAQFHAVGYAMINELGKDTIMKKYYGCLEDIMFSSKNPFLSLFENTKRTAIGLLNNNEIPRELGGQATLKSLEKYGENLVARLAQLTSHDSGHLFYVIGHGDAWNNNMMFLKDPRTNQLKHHVLLDFQVTRCGSPNLDLTYFLYSSVKSEVRRHHLTQLLRTYFEKLSSTVQLMTKTPFPFTFEEFLTDFKSKSLLGFWMNILYNVILDVLGAMDPSKMEADGDLASFFQDAITKWMEENHEKARAKTMELVDFLDEYEAFLAEVV